MLMSLYSAISGLQAFQQQLDVIGNNVANVNTVGYKEQTVSFSDLLSQTISGATGANSATNTGGVNALQVGMGVSVSAISTDMTTGSTQSTGNTNDVAISGNGFFIVQGGTSGTYQFTRSGDFSIDEAGNLTVNGYQVCGWQSYTTDSDGEAVFNTQKTVEPLNLYSDSVNGNKETIDPQQTTGASLTGTLSPSDTASGEALNDIYAGTATTLPDEPSATATVTAYDAQGNSYDIQVKMYKCYTDTTQNITSYYWAADPSDAANLALTNASGYIEFDSNGNMITTDATNYNTAPTITLAPQGNYAGSAAFDVTLDFSDISYYTSSTTGIAVSSCDGYAGGYLEDYAIGSDGVITGIYSNDQKKVLGMIALAVFSNPSGLAKIGDNLYITTANSGSFTGGVAAGSGGTSALTAGALELSNVDLTTQLSEMMIAQRAYQANSKVITTTDDMLDTLLSLIR